MMWRRFAGSTGSCRAGSWNAVAGRIERAALAAAVLVSATVAGAGVFDGFDASASAEGVVVGDEQHGDERSVIVSDGEGSAAYVPGEAVTMAGPQAEGWGYPQALINRCLGPACPRWVGQADVLLLWQGNVPATPLLTLDAEPFPTQLNGSQLPYVMGTGPRTAVLFNVNRCTAIEGNYFNAGNFSASRPFAAPAEGPLAWAALGNFNVGDIYSGTASTAGRIQSFELNWRRNTGRSLTFLAGFRWIQWNDSLAITDSYDDGVESGIDTLAVNTVNDLYGGQIGFDALLFTVSDVVRFNGVAKAGVYGNLNPGATMTVGGDRVPATSYYATGSSTGFFGEVGVNGTVRLTEHLFWRAGYNFFWIGGIATSLNQLNAFDMTVPDGKLNLDGSVFLQGVNTGIEAIW